MKNNTTEERIWIFIAYKEEGLPMFSKLFNNYEELKVFSGEHSAKNKMKIKRYSSTYLDLFDTEAITKAKQQGREEMRGEILEMFDDEFGDDTSITFNPSLNRKIEELLTPNKTI